MVNDFFFHFGARDSDAAFTYLLHNGSNDNFFQRTYRLLDVIKNSLAQKKNNNNRIKFQKWQYKWHDTLLTLIYVVIMDIKNNLKIISLDFTKRYIFLRVYRDYLMFWLIHRNVQHLYVLFNQANLNKKHMYLKIKCKNVTGVLNHSTCPSVSNYTSTHVFCVCDQKKALWWKGGCYS